MGKAARPTAGEILADALELPPESRGEFVRQACAGDKALIAEVTSLLRAHAQAGGFLSAGWRQGATDGPAEGPAEGRIGLQVGAYRLGRVLGSGGMGTVYLADRVDAQFQKQVAIKLVNPGMGTEAILRRFRTERQVLANLEHPNIARLLDGGAVDGDLPYLVMEYVDGLPIDAYCDARRLPVPDRVRLFCDVCAAVSFAHRNLVVHRDLKPGNILVTADGTVKLLDFGIAKLLDPSLPSDATATWLRILTPRFASPEQVRGESVTTASDVYSLGVVLFELLTGRYPYPLESPMPGSVERAILADEPARPSASVVRPPTRPGSELARAAATRSNETARRSAGPTPTVVDDLAREDSPEQIALRRATTPRGLQRALRGDLDTILTRALQKDANRRYPAVNDLADDLRRHLDGRPVQARPDTPGYRFGKFVRRNKLLVATGLTVVLSLVAGLSVAIVQYRRAVAAHEEEVRQRLIADQRTREGEWLAYTGSLAAAESAIRSDQIRAAAEYLRAAPARLRGWEWRHLATRLDRSRLTVGAHADIIHAIEFSPDGRSFATASRDQRVKLWNARTGELVQALAPQRSEVQEIAFHPAGAVLAAGCNDGSVVLLSTETGKPIRTLPGPGPWAHAVDFSPDGQFLAVGFQSGLVKVWRMPDLAEVASWTAHPNVVDALAFSPDGRWLATGSWDHSVKLWEVGSWTLRRELRGHRKPVSCLAFNPDGTRLASGSRDASVIVWDVARGRAELTFWGHDGGMVYAVDFSDRRTVLSAGQGKSVLVWNAADGEVFGALRGHQMEVYGLAVSPDGSTVVTGAMDGVVKFWDPRRDDVRVLAGFRGSWLFHAIVDERARMLACGGAEDGIRLYDLAAGTSRELRVPGRERHTYRLAFAPGDTMFAAGHGGGVLALWDVRGRHLRSFAAHEVATWSVEFDRSGRLLSASHDGLVKLWTAGGELLRVFSGHRGIVYRARFSPDGSRVASASADSTIRLWDVETGAERAVLRGHRGEVRDIAFDSAGERLASASPDGSVRLWDARSGAPLATLLDERTGMWSVGWSSDDRRLAVGAGDHTIRMLDPAERRLLLTLHGHADLVTSVTFGDHDRVLVSSARDGTVRLWDADPAAAGPPGPTRAGPGP